MANKGMVIRPKVKGKRANHSSSSGDMPFNRGDLAAHYWQRAKNNPELLTEFHLVLLRSHILVPVIPDDNKTFNKKVEGRKSGLLLMLQDSATGAIYAPFFTSMKAANIGGREIAKAANLKKLPFLKDTVSNFFKEVYRLGHQAHMNRNGLHPKVFMLNEIETVLGLSDKSHKKPADADVTFDGTGEVSRPETVDAASTKTKKNNEAPQTRRAIERKMKKLRKLLDTSQKANALKDQELKVAQLRSMNELAQKDKKVVQLAHRLETYKDIEERVKKQSQLKILQKEQYYEAQMLQLQNELALSRKDLETVKRPWKWPGSLEEVLSMGLDYFSDRLVYHEDLAQTARDYALGRESKMIRDAWEMISALGQFMYKMKFIDGVFSEKLFTDETGIELAMTEGRLTKKNKNFERFRTFIYQGQEITSFAHVKGSGDLRLYFHILEKERRILIYHLGEHLPNAQSKAL